VELSFYDHDRMHFAGVVPVSVGEAEFMTGDYSEHGGVGEGGDFKIVLHRLQAKGGLSPQLRVFGDAVGAFQEAIRLGLLTRLSEVEDSDEFARRLLGLGLRDRSEIPLDATPAQRL
jgi:hypothetical protein